MGTVSHGEHWLLQLLKEPAEVSEGWLNRLLRWAKAHGKDCEGVIGTRVDSKHDAVRACMQLATHDFCCDGSWVHAGTCSAAAFEHYVVFKVP